MSVLVVRVPLDEVEACSDWLFELGATAIEERTEGDDPTLVVGFRSDDEALHARSVLQERWPCRLEDTGDERAWRDRWLEFVEPVEVAGLLVHAPWHDVGEHPDPTRRVSIDPGRAFGSGHHPTTRLAIEFLAQTVEPDDQVLDAGCGTGILSIAAAKLGAGLVTGVDLDHDILAVAEANVVSNEVEDRVVLSEAPLLNLQRSFDVTVANIVVGDLRPLLPTLVEATERVLIVTGYLDGQLDGLIEGSGARVASRSTLEGWSAASLIPRG